MNTNKIFLSTEEFMFVRETQEFILLFKTDFDTEIRATDPLVCINYI